MAEFIIYCDESVDKGRYFSNFYGGLLVRSKDLLPAIDALEMIKVEQNLLGEVKWSKVTQNYVAKYVALMDAFFDLVAADTLKVRIMFTHNVNVPRGLSSEQIDQQYFLLYYQFLKHAFGIGHCPKAAEGIKIRVYLDELPDNREKCAQFKAFVVSLSKSAQFRAANATISADAIAEVDSKKHVLLQCLDIVLGAMNFRLNDMHKVKPEGATARGKRTVAKEKLYKHILRRIKLIYPNFNIGISTGSGGDQANRWKHPYRHWKFIPTEFERDLSFAKP